MKLADQAKSIKKLLSSDVPPSAEYLREIFSDSSVDETGNTALHYAAKLGLLDKINPEVLASVVTPAVLLQPNLANVSVMDLARAKQQMWALPKEAVYDTLYVADVGDLRPHQLTGLEKHREWSKRPIDPLDVKTKESLIWAATGSGKTRLAGEIIKENLAQGKKTLWVVDKDELLNQARAEIERLTGEPCEIEKAGLKASGKAKIVIASTQSMYESRLTDFATRFTPDEIFFDEAHHSLAPTCMRVKGFWPDSKLVNLTATPYRADIYEPLDLGEVLVYYPLDKAIEDGYCVPARLIERLPLDFTGVKTAGGDYEHDSLSAAMCRDVNVQVCLDLIAKHIPGNKSLLLAASVAHGKLMTARLQAMGFKVGEVYGETKPEVREKNMQDIRTGELEVLVSYNVIKEGNDIPELTNIFFMRPTKLDTLYHQAVNRGCRVDPKNPNKKDYGLVDVVDRKKVRMGRRVDWPDETEVSRARLASGTQTTAFEIFLRRFRVRKEVAAELLTGEKAPTLFNSPEVLYKFLNPSKSTPNATLTKLEELWPNANSLKEMKQIAALLRCNDINMFTQIMVNKGCVYMKDVQPKNMSELEELIEKNGRDHAVDPAYSIFGTPKNFIANVVGTGRLEFAEQIKALVSPVTYGSTTVNWTEPLKQGGFNYLDFDDPHDKNKQWMLIRDKKTGGIAGFTRTKEYGNYRGNVKRYWPAADTWKRYTGPLPLFPMIPDYYKTNSWQKDKPSASQKVEIAKSVAKILRIKVGDAEKRLEPGHPEFIDLCKLAGSALISANRHREFLKSMPARLDGLRPSMTMPKTSSKPAPAEPISPTVKAAAPSTPQVKTVTMDPVKLLADYKLRINSTAKAVGEDPGLLHAAATKAVWRLHREGTLTAKGFEALLAEPKSLVATVQPSLGLEQPELA